MAGFSCNITDPRKTLPIPTLPSLSDFVSAQLKKKLLNKAPTIKLPKVPKIPNFDATIGKVCPRRYHCPFLSSVCPLGYTDRKG